MTPNTVFFIGKPGSGKGTQARLLAQKTGWNVLASGEQFRTIAEAETPVGRKVKEEIDNGFLMPPWFAMYLYLHGLFSLPETADVIFDGFNRKEEEARLIIDSLAWLGRPFVAIEIQVSDEEVRTRLKGRSQIAGRMDDLSVDTRLQEYQQYTVKALEIFNEMGVLISVNGEQTPEQITEDVQKALKLI